MLNYESEPRTALIDVIRQVRQRWRLKLAVRGAVGFLAATILALVASAYALEALKFTPGAILTFRVGLLLVAAALAGWFLVRPLLRKVSDEQVALYLEEHEPTLEATIVTALEAERAGQSHEMSPALVRKLVEGAIERVHEIEDGRRIETVPVRRYAMAAGGVAIVALALFAFGPAYLRHALSALLVISRDVEAAAPYRIEVTPGSITVPKGADQTITAKLHGFTAAEAQVFTRKSPEAAFDVLPMVRAENGDYDGLLFDLAEGLDYYVEAGGVRSPTFALKVVELPYVKQLDLEYHFPAYTGLEPRTVEDGGDVAALAGTDVRLKIQPTMAANGGRIVMNDGTSVPLSANPDGTLAGNFKVTANGFYNIELDGPSGEKVPASPQYAIDILQDQAPTVTLSKPGRDTDATALTKRRSRSIAAASRRRKSVPAIRSISKNSAFSRATPFLITHGPPTTTGRAPRSQPAISISCASVHSARISNRRNQWVGAAAAAVAAVTSARCRSSSGRSLPAPSKCSAIASRWARTRPKRQWSFWRCRRAACVSRSRDSSIA
jgi:hypothetical protein